MIRSTSALFKTGIFLLVLASSACKKEKQVPRPKWFDESATFHFECLDTTNTINSLVNLNITSVFIELFHDNSTTVENLVKIYEVCDSPSNAPNRSYFGYIGSTSFYKRNDGLYQRGVDDCSMGFFNTTYLYLTIPASPSTGEAVPLLGCGHQASGQNLILNADTVLTVPAGTFHTFCVLHPDSSKSYWNRDVGIIQYELYEQYDANLLRKIATLKLRSVQ